MTRMQQQNQQEQEQGSNVNRSSNSTNTTTTNTTHIDEKSIVSESSTVSTTIYSLWNTVSSYVPFTTTTTTATGQVPKLQPIYEVQVSQSGSSSDLSALVDVAAINSRNNQQLNGSSNHSHRSTNSNRKRSNNNTKRKKVDNDEDDKNDKTSVSTDSNDNNITNNSNNNSNNVQLSFFDWLYDNIILIRLYCGMIVNHPYVQTVIVLLIIINAILMGIYTFDFVENNLSIQTTFDTIDLGMLCIFTIELVLQLIYYNYYLFLDGWLVFDFIVIVISWFLSESRIVRSFRVFRSLRLITRIRVMKDLITAIFAVMPRMFAVGGLLGIVSYVFAVMFTELFHGSEYTYWTTLESSFFTLFQIMTLDNWAQICREMIVESWWAWIPIVIYLIVASFVITNLIIAVVCDAVSVLRDNEKAMLYGKATHGNNSTNNSTDDVAEQQQQQQPYNVVSLQKQIELLEQHVNSLTQIQNDSVGAVQQLVSNHPELITSS